MAILSLCACQSGPVFEPTNFPVSQEAARADWPRILPLGQLAASQKPISAALPQTEKTDDLSARAQRLRQRANTLSAPVISTSERQRLDAALAK